MIKPYYDDGGIVIYYGDCFDVLPDLAPLSAAAVVTDPPFVYSVAHSSGNFYATKIPGNSWSDADVMGRWFACCLDLMKTSIDNDWSLLSFCSPTSYPVFFPHAFRRFDKVSCLTWDKGRIGTGQRWRRQFELLLYAYNAGAYWDNTIHDRSDVLPFKPNPNNKRGHPIDKPVELLVYVMEPIVPSGALVIDPFMGGGSTLIAARQLGISAIGIESEERYCEVAAKRLAQGVMV